MARLKGTPKTGGRRLGTPNKNPDYLKALCRQYTPDAIGSLVEIVRTGSEPGRITAANSLLDRGYGKPAQAVSLAGDQNNPLQMIVATGVPRILKQIEDDSAAQGD